VFAFCLLLSSSLAGILSACGFLLLCFCTPSPIFFLLIVSFFFSFFVSKPFILFCAQLLRPAFEQNLLAFFVFSCLLLSNFKTLELRIVVCICLDGLCCRQFGSYSHYEMNDERSKGFAVATKWQLQRRFIICVNSALACVFRCVLHSFSVSTLPSPFLLLYFQLSPS